MLVRALAGGGELGDDDLVDQRDVDLDVEDLGGQLDGAAGRAVRRADVDGRASLVVSAWSLGHTTLPEAALDGGADEDHAAAGAGDGALDEQQARSASTAWTVRFCVVVRTWPMRPAMRVPLKTRAGVAQAPMEPGERCLRWTPWPAPRPLKLWRFMTPA